MKQLNNYIKKLNSFKKLKYILSNKAIILVCIIFLCELFLRFYQMDIKNPFGFDQVDNAWAAQKIIVHHQFPLVGMPAKGNSGIFLGPVYYYLIAVVYWFTNLNPIASGVFAGLTSIFTFWTLFYVAKKLFSIEVAVIAVFINTFILSAIIFDRIQWNVNFIPSVSLLIFYLLYRITQGDAKKIIPLAILTGLFFSIHLTAIFFPIIIFLTLPFFPKTRETLKYILLSLPLFLIWLIPNILYQAKQASGSITTASYLSSNFHGFHLRRVVQLAGDGLIQFSPYLFFDKLTQLKFITIPLFFFLYLYKSISKSKLIFCYLILLWFIVPWFGFATYKGEISDYYFSINRFIALLIIAYFFVRIWMVKNIIPKLAVILLLIFIAIVNVINFFPYKYDGLKTSEGVVLAKIKNKEIIKFQWGVPESFLYYYFLRQKGIIVY